MSSQDTAENSRWLTSRRIFLLRLLNEHRSVVDLLLTWAAP